MGGRKFDNLRRQDIFVQMYRPVMVSVLPLLQWQRGSPITCANTKAQCVGYG